MSSRDRDIFSKHLPNIKLATRFDADGKEIQVERREDEEQNIKEQEIFDILVAAGYYRARIKGLSSFDKIVGGMTWCIESCDFDVNVDLLFHENLTIGQKISLTEKIVTVLPKMKCPYALEPHQIQGLDFINIFPVIQWLVKRSVENRAIKAERLKNFAVNEFHNYNQFEFDREHLKQYEIAKQIVQEIEDINSPRRQYKRKDVGNEDEKTRIRITLLEYGNKGSSVISTPGTSAERPQLNKNAPLKSLDDSGITDVDEMEREDDISIQFALDEKEKLLLDKHYSDLKDEMIIDTKQLSEQTHKKTLETTKSALEKKIQRVIAENNEFEDERKKLEKRISEQEEMKLKVQQEIEEYDGLLSKSDEKLVQRVENLIKENEDLKKTESKYKDDCRQELAKLEKEIKDAEELTSENGIAETKDILENEKVELQKLRLQLAKKNRAIVALQRQLDNIPDRTELAQYQRRFLELYNQVSAKHRETKQFYTLYNTLDDTKLYLEKELSLLNSIYETYSESMTNPHSREQFIKQFEQIVDGVKQTLTKVKKKCDEEKTKHDEFKGQLLALVEEQRKYAAAVKQLTKECQRNQELLMHLKSLQNIVN